MGRYGQILRDLIKVVAAGATEKTAAEGPQSAVTVDPLVAGIDPYAVQLQTVRPKGGETLCLRGVGHISHRGQGLVVYPDPGPAILPPQQFTFHPAPPFRLSAVYSAVSKDNTGFVHKKRDPSHGERDPLIVTEPYFARALRVQSTTAAEGSDHEEHHDIQNNGGISGARGWAWDRQRRRT